MEVLAMMEECGGNIREAARRLRLSPNTVSQHYKAGLLNSGKARAAFTHHGRMKALPRDARGQIAVGTPRRAR
jgi:DNA-binding transcriptional ArsR family regulator